MNRVSISVACAMVAVVLATDALAQSGSLFDAAGFQPNRDYVTPTSFGPGLRATEHVDVVTGSVILTFTDLELPSSGGRLLAFQRTYNSKGPFGGTPGQWSFGVAGLPLWIEDSPTTPELSIGDIRGGLGLTEGGLCDPALPCPPTAQQPGASRQL